MAGAEWACGKGFSVHWLTWTGAQASKSAPEAKGLRLQQALAELARNHTLEAMQTDWSAWTKLPDAPSIRRGT